MKTRKAVLFLGNDINNTVPGNSWEQLVKDLIEFAGARGEIDLPEKPFPLVYEQIYLHLLRSRKTTEFDLKKRIADWASKFSPNIFHRSFLDLGFTHVITTNYDHAIEKALSQNSESLVNQGLIDERRYSLFRNFDFGRHKIWHMHGEVSRPNSINLGYEQYSGYLQAMRSYVVTGARYEKRRFLPLLKRLNHPEHEVTSWIDLMFLHDIHIVGIKLDFVEMHLWWLLTFRARKICEGRKRITNRICYYFPASFVRNKHKEQTLRRLDLLKSCEVYVESCANPNEDKTKYYENVVKRLTEKL